MKTFRSFLVTVLYAVLVLAAQRASAASPTVLSTTPAAGAVVSSLTQVTVTFSAPVTGVEVGDFLVNGNPADGVSGTGSTRTFSFTQPGPGPVQFGWDGSHFITDLAGNRFDETALGSAWSCTLMDTIVPTVRVTTPTPGAVIGALTQIEVTFSEAVTGVDAADLLVNGLGASAVTGAGAGPYLFSFAQPANGTVTIGWAGGHGIRDTAASPNAFAPGSWTYSLNPIAATGDVVINEIMADNLNGLLDEDGDTSDWIELYNRGANSVNLLGWSLTDDAAQPGQWVFPAITLTPGQYLVVFASGKDRARAGSGTNHTSFVLAGSEYLGLYNAQLPRQVVAEFAPAYPEQRGDISWGRTSSNTLAYFATPTPRAANSAAANYIGFAAMPHASVSSGMFAQPFSVSLASETGGATIYYTLNGDVPTPTNGTPYAGAFTIAGTSNKAVIPLRAVAYRPGMLPSAVLTRTYIFPDQVIYQPLRPAGFPTNWVSEYPGATADTVADYEMDPQVLTAGTNAQIARRALQQIPTVSLVTSIETAFAPTNGVYTGRKKQGNQRPVNAEMILPDGSRVFQADCGFEIQGGSSPTDASGDWKDKKLSMRLIFKGDFGTPKLQAKVFDDSPVEEFDTLILDAGLNFWWTHMTDSDQRNRAKFITDTITSDLMNNAGMVAQHARYVHVYLDGLYWGLYFLHERMDEAAAASYLSGQKEDWDVLKHDASGLQNGSSTNYTAMFQVARSGLANNANYEQLQSFLDVPWFIDYMIINFWVGNDDWPHHNWYAWHRARTPTQQPWRFVSWDAEHTFKRWDYPFLSNGNLSAGSSPGELFNLLRANAEFRVLFGDRVHRLLLNGGPLYTTTDAAAFWSAANPSVNLPAAAYRKRVDEIWDSVVCESARWGDVATVRVTQPYTRELEYTRELNALFTITNIAGQTPNYFPLRGSNVLAQFRAANLYPSVAAPAFSQHGGRVAPGYSLYITNVAGPGSVYFTTNGTDPRSYGSGAVAPQAVAYAGVPVVLGQSMVVKARALLSGTNWSALNEAVFSVGSLGVPLRITEIMYNPPGGDAFEFIELQNIGATELNLGNFSFDGITYSFPPFYMLAAGARLVLASSVSPAAFASRYPGVVVAGYFNGSLANGGERIAIKDAAGNTVVSLDYDDANGWPTGPDGGGYSLEIIDPNGNPDDPANWRASSVLNGTPDQPNSVPAPVTVVLNEVMAENLTTTNNGGVYSDWLELRNTGASAVDLTGWSLSDNGDPRRFVFASGPMLAPGAYLLVWCDTNSAAPGLHTGFALDKDGSGLFLYDPNTNRVDAISFGAQLPDLTVGRVGPAPAEWQLCLPTPGTANIAAATGAVTNLAINEWLANAVPGGDDWLELYNRSISAPVALGGIYLGTSNAVFQFKALSFVAPGGFIQLFADEQPGPGHLDFKLSAAGGAIVLYDTSATEISRVTYGPQAQGVTQGRYPNGSSTIVTFPGSASPAASNYLLSYAGPLLNEILARNESTLSPWGEFSDWIEIANTNAGAIDLSNFGLAFLPSSLPNWRFPPGTSLAGNSYLRVWCDSSRAASVVTGPDLNTGFSLSGESGAVYLFSTNDVLLDFVEYGFQVVDMSLGRNGNQWRLLSNPTPAAPNGAPAPLGGAASLRINEWLSDPSHGDDWFELFNTGAQPVELGGLYVTDDPSLNGITQHQIAPLSFIGGSGFVQLHADGDPSKGRDHVNFNLDNLGESLRLYAADQTLIDGVDFGPLPKGASMGRLPDGAATIVLFNTTPTPGENNFLPLPDVVVNEVLTHTDPPLSDSIELFNPTGQSASVGGYFLSDSRTNFKKYRIPDGTTLPAGGFVVFDESDFNAGGLGSFGLNSARGGRVYLSAADGAGNLTGYRSVAEFGAARNGVSFGRYLTSVGGDYPAASVNSLGASNAYPKVGPIVVNELQYHPITGIGTNATESFLDEFIELHNISNSAVPLYDPAHATNSWRLRGGVKFDFPTGVSVPAKGYVLLVGFNPDSFTAGLASFRAKYGVPPSVPIYGPFFFGLDNGGENIELQMPDTPQGPGPDEGFVPYVLVDQVRYDDAYPWPAEADGTGASLQRRRPYQYGNDPVNWKALAPTAGRANVSGSDFVDSDSDGLPDSWEVANGLNANNAADANLDGDGDGHSNLEEFYDGTNPASAASRLDAPTITSHPSSQTVLPGENVLLSVVAGGTPSLKYQWYRNGLPLAGETNAALALTSAVAAYAGLYHAVVWNDGGFAASRVAKVTVNVPPSITQQPQLQVVNPGQAATFNVAAVGTGTITYQWRLNAVNLTGETAPSLTIQNAQLANEGDYSVLVTDEVATIPSASVRLVVRVVPMIIVPPRSITNFVGSTVTFTVGCSGSVPMTFFWRKGSIGIATNVVFITTNSLTLTNVQLSDTAQYRVIVTNYALSTQSTNATAFLQVLPPLRLQDLQLLVDGSASMNLSGPTNRNCAIEASSNLINWTTLTNLFYTEGLVPFTDATAVGVTNRFYRARLGP